MRSLMSFLQRRKRRQPDLVGRMYDWDGGAEGVYREQDAPTVAYRPHGIDSPQTLAEIVAQAEAEGKAPHEAAATGQRGEQVAPGWIPEPPPLRSPSSPPPEMPYPSGLSRVMVGQITYPDPADLSPDKDRNYRDMLRRVGVATGTHTTLEDTGMWALPALPPGNGTGAKL